MGEYGGGWNTNMRIKAVEGIKAYNHGSDLGAVPVRPSVHPSVRPSVGRSVGWLVGWLVRRSTSLDLRLSVCIPVRESELLHGYRLSAQPLSLFFSRSRPDPCKNYSTGKITSPPFHGWERGGD